MALRLLKPAIRLLISHGVTYPAFAAAVKRVFLEAAQEELRDEGYPLTDSAVSLLSGVHRRDVRNLSRGSATPDAVASPAPMNMATQVVACWLSEPRYLDEQGQAKPLLRGAAENSFDALVTRISLDIRPRAVLDELVRLGIAEDSADGVRLLETGFAPRQGFAEMAQLLQDNLHDHLAAATQNLDGKANFLEQSVFVDQITADSVQRLHTVSTKAWRQAFKAVMQEASARFDDDQQNAKPEDRTHRARFGSYFYGTPEDSHAHDAPPL